LKFAKAYAEGRRQTIIDDKAILVEIETLKPRSWPKGHTVKWRGEKWDYPHIMSIATQSWIRADKPYCQLFGTWDDCKKYEEDNIYS
jgi:hypothetical protein